MANIELPPEIRAPEVINLFSYRDVARIELQLPTRLLGDFSTYDARPNWKAVIQPDNVAQTNKDLSTMQGRADRRWDEGAYQLYEQARDIYQSFSSNEKQKVDEFRRKKRDVFVEFGLQYSQVFDLYRINSMLDFPKIDEKGDISLRIISEHSLVVGKVTQVLAENMTDQLVKEKVEREEIDPKTVEANEQSIRHQAINEPVIGSLLHDENKTREILFKSLTPDQQLDQIRALRIAPQVEIDRIAQNPELANGIYEILLHMKTEQMFRTGYPAILKGLGNIDTMLACVNSAGMPVVMKEPAPDGHYLPSTAERIINLADKLVQDTGVVTNLGRRYELSRQRYSPVQMVDKEFAYAQRCADEFAILIRNVNVGKALPKFVINSIFNQIDQHK